MYKTEDRDIEKLSKLHKSLTKQVCTHTSEFLAERNSSSWLKERSMIVRYEDVAMGPLGQSQRILHFAGFELTEKVKNWINRVNH